MGIRLTFPILCSILVLSACGHVESMRSARLEQATEFNQRGQRAFQRGEYQSAATLYENALLLDVAIENVSGIAINAVNLAKVNQVLGKTAVAERYLDRLLEDKALTYPTAQLTAASVQKSLLRLQENDAAGASEWAEKAATYCGSDCVLSGVIDNTRASIALRTNDADSALRWSERASSENNGSSPLEHANSLRLAAAAKLMKDDFDAALRLSEEALVIDKTLGLPEKIRQDLLLSAQAHDKLGHAERAAQCRDRAARIAATAVK